MPSSILQLGERGEDRGPLRARLARDELDGPPRGEHRPGRIAGGAADMGQPLVEEPERDAVAPLVEAADRRLEVGRRARHLAGREGRLRGTHLEVDAVRGGRRAVAGRPRPAPGPRGATSASSSDASSSAAAWRSPANAAASMAADRRAGAGRGRPASARRRPTAVRPGSSRGPRDGGSGRSAAGRARRPPDRVVPEGDGVARSRRGTRCAERLRAAGPQVGVERRRRRARGPVTERGGGPVGVDLERRGDRRQLVRAQRPVGQRQQAQDAAALRRADREAGDDQLVEGAGQRRARQLAARGQELLGDQRQAARSFGDEEQQAGRRPFALDPLDQRGQLVAVERRQCQALGGRGPAAIAARSVVQRVVAADDVGLVGADDRQPLVARDPGQERDERAGGGVGVVEVLEDEDDGLPLAEPAEQAEDALERSAPGGAPGRSARRRRPAQPISAEPRREIRQQPDDLGAPDRAGGQVVVGQVARGRADGPDDRAVRLVGAGRPGASRAGRSSARAAARIRSMASSRKRVTPTPAVPPSSRVRVWPCGGVVESRREPGECLLASHEARARVRWQA